MFTKQTRKQYFFLYEILNIFKIQNKISLNSKKILKNIKKLGEKVKIMSHAHKTRAHRFVKKNKTCRLCLSKKGAKYTCYLIYTIQDFSLTYPNANHFGNLYEIFSNSNAFYPEISTHFPQ